MTPATRFADALAAIIRAHPELRRISAAPSCAPRRPEPTLREVEAQVGAAEVVHHQAQGGRMT